jgi:hypothetical protein
VSDFVYFEACPLTVVCNTEQRGKPYLGKGGVRLQDKIFLGGNIWLKRKEETFWEVLKCLVL